MIITFHKIALSIYLDTNQPYYESLPYKHQLSLIQAYIREKGGLTKQKEFYKTKLKGRTILDWQKGHDDGFISFDEYQSYLKKYMFQCFRGEVSKNYTSCIQFSLSNQLINQSEGAA